MKFGPVIAVVILGGYVGLEAYTIRAASHRMEPAYIHNMLIEAKVATEMCESSALELAPRFTRTLQRATSSYQKELSESDSNLSEPDIEQQLAEQIAAAQTKVAEEVETKSCSHADIKAHFQRYRIYAKKTR